MIYRVSHDEAIKAYSIIYTWILFKILLSPQVWLEGFSCNQIMGMGEALANLSSGQLIDSVGDPFNQSCRCNELLVGLDESLYLSEAKLNRGKIREMGRSELIYMALASNQIPDVVHSLSTVIVHHDKFW